MGKMTKERQDYNNMKIRCYNKNTPYYHRYGGRGVTVCNEWLKDFELFTAWHKKTYIEGMTLDRINNNKGYSPSNCRWVSMKVQSNNREPHSPLYKKYTEDELSKACEYYDTSKISQSELARVMGVPRTTLQRVLWQCQ